MDEGRWEGEGGGPIHKPLGVPEKSSEVPISDLAKDDVTAHTTASTEKSTAISGDSVDAASYDASKTHPTVVAAGEPGDPAKSKYHGASTLPVEGKDGEGEPKAAPARKKSISERLHEGWQDLKHKIRTQHTPAAYTAACHRALPQRQTHSPLCAVAPCASLRAR